jgi:hypothetical protein
MVENGQTWTGYRWRYKVGWFQRGSYRPLGIYRQWPAEVGVCAAGAEQYRPSGPVVISRIRVGLVPSG